MQMNIRFRKFLSVFVSMVLVVGLISATETKTAEAAGDNMIVNGGFDAVGTWVDQDGKEVKAQEVVDDIIVHEVVENGDFENGNYQSGVNGWQCRSGASISVIDDSTDQTNKVLHIVSTSGGAQANFYFGQAGILEVGKEYTVSFDIRRTDGDGGITLYSDQVVGGWTAHG